MIGQERVGPAHNFFVAVERYRRTNLLTWEELAKKAGTGRQTLTNLRDSKERPRLVTVHKIADAIGMGEEKEKAEELAGYPPVGPVEPSDAEAREGVVEEDAGVAEEEGEAVAPPVDAREAILRDPRLNNQQAAVLVATFDAIVRAFQQPGPAPRRNGGEAAEEQRRAG